MSVSISSERCVLALKRGGIEFCTTCVGIMAVPPVVRPSSGSVQEHFVRGGRPLACVVNAPAPKTPGKPCIL